MAMRRPLLRALFLGWLTIIVLLLIIRGRHGWRCLIVEQKQPNSSSSGGTSTHLQVSRKTLIEVKSDLSNIHYVRHLQQRHKKHHHHRQSHSHGHIPQQYSQQSAAAYNAADGYVANRIAGPPDPLYRYPAAVSNSMVIPSAVVVAGDGSYGYADDKRIVPTGPNPLHH